MALRWSSEPEPGRTARARSRVRRAASLRPRDVPVLARALAWAIAARVLIGLRGFTRAARILRISPVEPVEIEQGAFPMLHPRVRRSMRLTFWMLDRLSRVVTCLPRSLVVQRALAREGIPGDLVIGCVTGEEFKAHAWVEVAGYPVGRGENGAREWARIARFRRLDHERKMEAVR